MNLHIPKIRVTYTPLQKALDILSLGLVTLMFVYIWNTVDTLPDKVPSHFDLQGKADAYQDKSILYSLPLIALFVIAVTSLPRLDPRWMNLPGRITKENAERVFQTAFTMMSCVQLACTLLFASILYQSVNAARQASGVIFVWPTILLISLIFVAIGVGYRRILKIAPN